jgi:hypothetical protein
MKLKLMASEIIILVLLFIMGAVIGIPLFLRDYGDVINWWTK